MAVKVLVLKLILVHQLALHVAVMCYVVEIILTVVFVDEIFRC